MPAPLDTAVSPRRRRPPALLGVVIGALALSALPAATASAADVPSPTSVAATAVPFGIDGVQPSYAVGDPLDVRVVGHTLAEGENIRFFVRPVGSTAAGGLVTGTGTEAAQGRLQLTMDAGYAGYELRARLRQGTSYVAGADTPWVPLTVESTVQPVATAFPAGAHHIGDDVVLPLDGPDLAQGDSVRLVTRYGGGIWRDVTWWDHVGDTIVARLRYATPEGSEFAVQTIRDGRAVAISAPVAGHLGMRELLVAGIRSVYRVGQTLRATAEVHPAKDGLTHRWLLWAGAGADVVTVKEGTTADALTLELPATMDLNGQRLYFESYAWAGTDRETYAGTWSTPLTVSDADPSEQLLFFEGLGAHYHQGYAINLDLVADPAIGDGDTVVWEWKWPGGEWAPFPGATGSSHELTAEQALDGVEVRATLDYAAEGRDPVVTEPVTIHHDDHGSPARQQPTVGGQTSYAAGETATLRLELPENGPTVLTAHRWERRAAGSDEWTTVSGDGAELGFTAAAADDGAAYRVSILKPTGEVAYGPSEPVVLDVAEAPVPEPVATTLRAADVRQVYGRGATLTVAVTPAASGAVEVALPGGGTLTGTLRDGVATLALPARALAPGRHALAVTYAGADGRFRPSAGRVAVTVAKAGAAVKVTPAKKRVERGRVARFRIAVAAHGVTPTGSVVVKVAGRSKVVRLDRRGRATVRIAVPARARTGAATARVVYRGDGLVERTRSTTRIRVTR
ncbi:MAG TPA: Ig-like domain-containing protein [Nocardioides sp.]|uniref:Ig-like domain-containing protein n=1 Tax=Nocardioides sp. TaxID=35761 RepID=UPI002B88301F|nr:Ig-like domain-containing protein [Nocardioides sp.]HTW14381.1 Ig-like domain-containing protein [Nocardioides sp.]